MSANSSFSPTSRLSCSHSLETDAQASFSWFVSMTPFNGLAPISSTDCFCEKSGLGGDIGPLSSGLGKEFEPNTSPPTASFVVFTSLTVEESVNNFGSSSVSILIAACWSSRFTSSALLVRKANIGLSSTPSISTFLLLSGDGGVSWIQIPVEIVSRCSLRSSWLSFVGDFGFLWINIFGIDRWIILLARSVRDCASTIRFKSDSVSFIVFNSAVSADILLRVVPHIFSLHLSFPRIIDFWYFANHLSLVQAWKAYAERFPGITV